MSDDKRKNKILFIYVLVFLLPISMIISVAVGAYKVDIYQVFEIIGYHILGKIPPVSSISDAVVWQIRVPRVLAGALVGSALAVAGCSYQGIFKNPLVEPYILGVSSGAAFGAALSIVLGMTIISFQVSSVLFAFLAVAATYLIATVRGNTRLLNLILAGLTVGAIFTAGLSYLKIISLPGQLQEITFWLMGGFYTIQWSNMVPLLIIPFFILVIFLLSAKLNILTLGDDTAWTSGVSVQQTKIILIVCATIITGVSVATVGIIAWVGLLVPHICRMVVGPDHRYLIPASVFFGATFMVICDMFARTLFEWEMPISILTSLVMAPIMISIIRKNDVRYFGA